MAQSVMLIEVNLPPGEDLSLASIPHKVPQAMKRPFTLDFAQHIRLFACILCCLLLSWISECMYKSSPGQK